MQIRANGNRRAVIFAVECQHGPKRIDRMAKIRRFLEEHSGCRPEWKALGKRNGESDQQYMERLKGIFVFTTELATEIVARIDEQQHEAGEK